VAIDDEPELQVPPGVPSNNAVVAFSQTTAAPVMGYGTGYTVTVVTALHPVGMTYVIMEVPVLTPVTIPVDEPIVAITVFPLTHVPPGMLLLSVAVIPTQVSGVPLIEGGEGFTDTVVVVKHSPPPKE
jgi:hypothetical protein